MGCKFKVGDKVYFKDGSWNRQAFTIQKIEGHDLYFNSTHGKLSSPFLDDWLTFERPDVRPEFKEEISPKN